jgi:hypothetical protein
MVANVVVYPVAGLSDGTALLIVCGLAAVVLASLGIARTAGQTTPLLIGLWLGYLAFGLAFTMHISTHLYYSLPIVPIVALSAAYAVERLRIASPAVKAVAIASCCALIAGAALKIEERLRDPTYCDDVRVYEQVGVAAGHTAA